MTPKKKEALWPADRAPLEGSRIVNSTNLPADADDCKPDDPEAFRFASWCRVISGAPIENRLVLFGMMAADACTLADATRQQLIDDALEVACELGLIKLFGLVHVEEALASAFRRAA
jgi:hypothetical protein